MENDEYCNYNKRKNKLVSTLKDVRKTLDNIEKNNPDNFSYDMIENLQKKIVWCSKERADLVDLLEVEDFLVNGPGKTEDVVYEQ
jgi:hypothetical protein